MTPDLLVGAAAVLLSLGALVVSVVQTRILAGQQRAAVWPHLHVETSHLDSDFTVVLSNSGVGPAIVREASFEVHGRRYPSASRLAYREVMDAMGDSLNTAGRFFDDVEPGDVLRPGDSVELLSTLRSEPLARRMDALVGDPSFHARIRFADVYGSCWTLDNADVHEDGACPDDGG